MSIFGDIMSAIFGHSASATPAGSAPQVQPSPKGSAPQVQPATPTSATATPPTQTTVDVAAVLDGLAKQKKQKLKWRNEASRFGQQLQHASVWLRNSTIKEI